jgi:hypothetical protein
MVEINGAGSHRDPWDPDEDGLDLDDIEMPDPFYGMWLEYQSEDSTIRMDFNPAFDTYDPRRIDWEPPNIPSGALYYACTSCGVSQREERFGRTKTGNQSPICLACAAGKPMRKSLPPPASRRSPRRVNAGVPGRAEGSPRLVWRIAHREIPGILLLQEGGPLGLLLMLMITNHDDFIPSPMHLEIDELDQCWFPMTTDVREGLDSLAVTSAIATGQIQGMHGISTEHDWFRYLLFSRGSTE